MAFIYSNLLINNFSTDLSANTLINYSFHRCGFSRDHWMGEIRITPGGPDINKDKNTNRGASQRKNSARNVSLTHR